MNRHLHTLRTPRGRVSFTHHDLTTLSDGTDKFVSDGYLVPIDGSMAIPLSVDELLSVLAVHGTGARVGLSGLPTASPELADSRVRLRPNLGLRAMPTGTAASRLMRRAR